MRVGMKDPAAGWEYDDDVSDVMARAHRRLVTRALLRMPRRSAPWMTTYGF